MNILRKITYAFILFIVTPAIAQTTVFSRNKDSLRHYLMVDVNLHTPYFKYKPIDFSSMDFSKDQYIFTSFNPNTSLFDNYQNNNNNFLFMKSGISHSPKSNLFTEMVMNNPGMQNFPHAIRSNSRPIRDSFNPNGATNMRDALLGGILGFIFN